jgi:hypothetical protein
VRVQLGQLLVEVDIHAEDGGDGRSHGFLHVSGIERRL